MDSDEIRDVDTDEVLDEILGLARVLLYKHSTRCGTSLRAMAQVERYVREGTDIPVYGIDVTRQRDLSGSAAERLGVRHESPQIILIRDGQPEWNASHSNITVEALRAATADPVSE